MRASWVETGLRILLIVAIALYFVASFIVAQATLLSLGCSLVIGSIVGVAVRYIGGSTNLRPDGRRIADALRRCQECERQRRMAYIPRVDQHVAVAALEQNIVRRQPVANEDVELRQPIKHHSL